ncbi:hypothetical protein TNIN_199181 [Trichonephila inaurata madagascariensis]|uniref:CARD domain-containing protein n=1 Tax=Trichonephila inaurata madagascariensis TaxID=2747483 RepID=A0A8X6WS91_9ARAC|nr:hypothetical protein TNIN_199181 [Trichonephila inaurata madagascariensis]
MISTKTRDFVKSMLLLLIKEVTFYSERIKLRVCESAVLSSYRWEPQQMYIRLQVTAAWHFGINTFPCHSASHLRNYWQQVAMKFLALLFLAGLALSSAIPVPSYEQDVNSNALEDFYLDLALEADDEETLNELKNKLRERFQEILEKIKDAIENGKVVKGEYLEKLKEIREKLRDLKGDLSEKAKELLEKLKEKAKDYWNKLLEKLKPEKRDVDEAFYADDDTINELKNKLRERFQEILEKVKEAIEKGKVVKGEYLEKLKEIREKLRDLKLNQVLKNCEDLKGDLSEKAKELLEKLKEKAKDYWNKLLEKLKPEKRAAFEVEFADEDPKTELGKKLKEHLDDILSKLKEAIENGKTVRRRPKELLKQLKEKAKDYWKKILDKLTGKETRAAADDDVKGEIEKTLRESLDRILEKIKEAIDNGKVVKEDTLNKVLCYRNSSTENLRKRPKRTTGKKILSEFGKTVHGIRGRLLLREEERGPSRTSTKMELLQDTQEIVPGEIHQVRRMGQVSSTKGLEKSKTKLENFLEDSRGSKQGRCREALDSSGAPQGRFRQSLYDELRRNQAFLRNKHRLSLFKMLHEPL